MKIKEKRQKLNQEPPFIRKQKLDSISTWIKKIETRPSSQIYSKHGLVTTELMESYPIPPSSTVSSPIYLQEKSKTSTRPTSARTTTSSVRFAPSVDDKKVLKKSNGSLIKIKTPMIDF